MSRRQLLALVSGGMDSVTLLYEYQTQISHVVSFHYGSKHNDREIPFAKCHSERLKKVHLTIALPFIGEHFQSSLLKGGDPIPHAPYSNETLKSTVVPFRNGILLSVATGLAENLGLSGVMIANHFGDHAVYPDCRESFVRPLAEAILVGTDGKVELIAPYTDLLKGEIAERGKKLGVPFEETWSCYEGGELHCGTCSTCRERKIALGDEDPTQYRA